MIDYSEEWLVSLLFQCKGSVGLKACSWAIPSALLALVLVSIDEYDPTIRDRFGLMELNKSQLWSMSTAILGMLLGFRTNRAMARFWEGTGLLHQMRGEWFDSISCCVTFSIGAMETKRSEVYRFRHTIVRLMSLCHGSALEEIAGGSECVPTIDALGLDNATLCHLKNCKEIYEFNRVEVLLHLTQSIITKSLDDGILTIPPPILSRVYQTLSRGFVNLLNAKKIADTRFPFPYAQMIAMLLFAHLLLTPLMVSCLIQSKIWAPVFTFVPIFAMFSINYVGVELENPFGTDDNDLPLAHFQGEMNKCLMMLLHESADLIAGVSDTRCITDFEVLVDSMIADQARFNDVNRSERGEKDFLRRSVSDFAKFVDIHADDFPVATRRSCTSFIKPPGELKEEKKLEGTPPSSYPVKAEPKAGSSLFDSDTSLPGLRTLVETQVKELSSSIAALSEFSNALPGALNEMLSNASSPGGQSFWRSAMLRTRSLDPKGSGSKGHLLVVPPIREDPDHPDQSDGYQNQSQMEADLEDLSQFAGRLGAEMVNYDLSQSRSEAEQLRQSSRPGLPISRQVEPLICPDSGRVNPDSESSISRPDCRRDQHISPF